MTKPIHVLKAVQEFLSFCGARNDSPNTLRAYNRDLLQFVQFVGHDTPVSDLSRKKIRHYLFSLDVGLRAGTVRRKLAAIRSFCGWLFAERYLDTNPSEGISGPRVHQELPDVPSEANMQQLLGGRIRTASPERDRLILELLYGSGLRASEVTGINVDDFRGKDTLLVHGKGSKDRLVPVGKCARRALVRWLRRRKALIEKTGIETNALFFSVGPHESAERLDVRSIHRTVRGVALSKHLPPYHPHLLRHACATTMHDHGAPIQAIATLLGHVNLSTSQIYTRVSTGRMLDVFRRAHPHAGGVGVRQSLREGDSQIVDFKDSLGGRASQVRRL